MRSLVHWPGGVDPREPFPEPRAKQQGGPALGTDHRRFRAEHFASETMLARLCCDHHPAAIDEGIDRVLGPWADTKLSERTRLIAVALFAFADTDESHVTPLQRWARGKPIPKVAYREAARAVLWAPQGLYRVLSLEGDQATLEELSGIAGEAKAPPVVTLREPGHIHNRDLAEGDLLFARVGIGESRAVACCPIGLAPHDGIVAHAPLVARELAQEEWLPHHPCSHEQALRLRGHDFIRRLLEELW